MTTVRSFVSIIIPCLNERKFIAGCLDSIVANDYPQESLEILVIDGMSEDGTRGILNDYVKRHAYIRVVDNPQKNKPRALNIGIEAARGDVIIRMDAHALYEPDYISKSVQYLDEYQADNVGGIRKTLPGGTSVLARAIAYSISHPFAVGNATYRTGSKTIRWVDTVFGGCYRRDVFDRIGMFDEALIRGQDREFNVRLRQAGGKILLVPDIICYYYARADLERFIRWTFVGGLTPFYISRLAGKVIFSWRNLIPLSFFLTLMTFLFLALIKPVFRWAVFALGTVYLIPCIVFSIPIARKERDMRFIVAMPFIFAATHLLYGVGSLVGLFKPVERRVEWTKV